MFINNCPTMGISIRSFCKPNGAKDELEDGSLWKDEDHTKEALELLHALICEHEETESLSCDEFMYE